MDRQYDFAALEALLKKRSFKALREALLELNEVDIAEFLGLLNGEEAVLAFRTLPKGVAADVFAELEPETQQLIVAAATDAELAVIVEDLYVDDAVDMLEDMPANVVKRILKNATPEMRGLINQFLKYPEHSAGSIMTAEFTDLRPTMTVEQAIEHIRRTGEDRETVYTCYVVGPRRRLLGVVTVRSLLLARDSQLVSDVMEDGVISVATGTDQEEAVRLLQRYGFLSLPVVDAEGRLVGIVTVDDAVDVMEQEATEDFEKMAAMAPSEKPYLKTGVFSLARHRIVWLLVLMISGMITGGILGRYDGHCRDAAARHVYSHAYGYRRQRGQPEQHAGHPRPCGERDYPAGFSPGAVEGAACQPAGGRGAQRGEFCSADPHLSRQRDGGPHCGADDAVHRDRGKNHRRRAAAHCKGLPDGPGHHGLAAHHHHCGRGVACDLFCRGAPAAAAVTRRKSRRKNVKSLFCGNAGNNWRKVCPHFGHRECEYR